jgi:hypothetical protein
MVSASCAKATEPTLGLFGHFHRGLELRSRLKSLQLRIGTGLQAGRCVAGRIATSD